MEQTVERVRAGQIEAFAEIVREYQHQVWRIAAHALRDVAATEDLVQQVFVNVYFKLDQYQSGRDFGAWVRSIARNQVRKAIRDGMRDARKQRLYGEFLAAGLEEEGARASEQERQQALREALARCREHLSPAAAQALDLRYRRTLGFDEIAAALQRTVAATRQLLGRTRVALRRCVEQRMAQR